MRKKKFVGMFVFSLLLISGVDTLCQATLVQWKIEDGGNDHFYEAIEVSEGITWTDAKAAAELAGGYLATITSAEENEFVFNLVNDERFWFQTSGPWLGGYQDYTAPDYSEPGGGWRWVTDEPFDYLHWKSGEPNNDIDNENSLHFTDNASYWNDIADFYSNRGYVVETPEPATLLLLTLGGLSLLRKRRA